ncbi:EFC4A protein, partial [Atractosteus spatula]|nr:EFC4A protein [Atractosteus spatula]
MQRLQSELPLSPEQLESVFDSLDRDRNGYLTPLEFSMGLGQFLGVEVWAEGESSCQEEPPLSGWGAHQGDPQELADLQLSQALEELGAAHIFVDQEELRTLWAGLREERPELLLALQELLLRVSAHIQDTLRERDNLEQTLRRFAKTNKNNKINMEQNNKKIYRHLQQRHIIILYIYIYCRQMEHYLETDSLRECEHEQVVRSLYEEMETQMKEVKDKQLMQDSVRQSDRTQQLQRQLETREQELHSIVGKQRELEQELRALGAEQQDTRSQNQQLHRVNAELAEQLEANRQELHRVHSLLQHTQQSTLQEQREKERDILKVSKNMQKEKESLMKQLDLLREMNKKLRDEKDARHAQKMVSFRQRLLTPPPSIYLPGTYRERERPGEGETSSGTYRERERPGEGETSSGTYRERERPGEGETSSGTYRERERPGEGETSSGTYRERERPGEGETSSGTYRERERPGEGETSSGTYRERERPGEGETSSGTYRERERPGEGETSSGTYRERERPGEGETSSGTYRERERPGEGETSSGTNHTPERRKPLLKKGSVIGKYLLEDKPIKRQLNPTDATNQVSEEVTSEPDRKKYASHQRGEKADGQLEEAELGQEGDGLDVSCPFLSLSFSFSLCPSVCLPPRRPPQRVFKLVFIGNSGVGKTSFIQRYCRRSFLPNINATVGMDFQVRTVTVDSTPIALQLWDTAGQERFRSITQQYFRKADGMLAMYDVTSSASFIAVRNWLDSVQVRVSE